jgi:hypothetical protein
MPNILPGMRRRSYGHQRRRRWRGTRGDRGLVVAGSSAGAAILSMTLKTAARYALLLIVFAIPFSASDTRAMADARADRCSFTLWPLSLSFDSAGGRAQVYITTEGYCTWIAQSDRAWISVTSPASGTGEGVVTLAITENSSGLGRTGTLAVGGETVAIRQDGSRCSR